MYPIKQKTNTMNQALLISKYNIKTLIQLPKITNVHILFLINNKQYKKNLLLLYILINMMFETVTIEKKNFSTNIFMIKLVLKKYLINNFLINFIKVYLPLLETKENNIKKSEYYANTKKKLNDVVYKLKYFAFPIIPELSQIKAMHENIETIINDYKMLLHIQIKTKINYNDTFEILLRLYRLPCRIKMTIKNQ